MHAIMIMCTTISEQELWVEQLFSIYGDSLGILDCISSLAHFMVCCSDSFLLEKRVLLVLGRALLFLLK